MHSLLLALALCAEPAELTTGVEGRGGTGVNPEIYGEVLRRAPRFRLGVGTVGIVAAQDLDFFTSVAGGGGVYLEAGAIFGDFVSLTYRGELTTTAASIYGSNGAFVDLAIGEHLAVGLGAAFTVWSPFFYLGGGYVSSFTGFTFPVRAHVMWGSRKDESVARRAGWTISFHFAPGVSIYPSYYGGVGIDGGFDGFAPQVPRTRVCFTGGIGIGHLWW
ncbi:MAG: hypothetical protein QM817_40115 [Archangium sp.]